MVGCNLIIRESTFIKFTSASNESELRKIILKNFTDSNSGIRWCPTPNCNTCIQSTTGKNKEILCENCFETICFVCGKESHRPSPCEIIEFWEKRSGENIEHIRWLMENTKKCPNCKKHIEKNMGCNHMTCNKKVGGCGHEYCWICLGPWTKHNDFYNCNFIEKTRLEKLEKDKQDEIKVFKTRFEFYYKRVTNHKKSLTFILKLQKKMKDVVSQLTLIKKIPYDNCIFLNTSVECLISVKRVLRNAYIYAYVLNEKKDKVMTEHNLWMLEKECEKLLQLLEGKKIDKMLNIHDNDQFNKEFIAMKENIINLTNVTSKFYKNLITEIESNILNTKTINMDS
jgi:ariadne-1